MNSKDVIVFGGMGGSDGHQMGTDGHNEEANLFNQKMAMLSLAYAKFLNIMKYSMILNKEDIDDT